MKFQVNDLTPVRSVIREETVKQMVNLRKETFLKLIDKILQP